MERIELSTSSLPRKRSTPELHWQYFNLSGRRGSNSRPSAWKADALPTELLPPNQQKKVGRARFELTKACASRFTVCPSWPLWYLPRLFQTFKRADRGIRTHGLLITNQLLWPAELCRLFKLGVQIYGIYLNRQNFSRIYALFSLPQQTSYPEGNESEEPCYHQCSDYGNQGPFPTAALAADDCSSSHARNI